MAELQHTTTVSLAARQSMALPDISGTALQVKHGRIWITQENDTRDIVLGPGEVFVVERDGLTIIEAQNDASFRALGRAFERGVNAAAASARARALWQGLRKRVAGYFSSASRRPLPYY